MGFSLSDNLFVGNLVRLTAQQPEDRDEMARWTEDSEFSRLWSDSPARPRTSDYFADVGKSKESDNRRFEFAIRPLTEDRLIGVCELSVLWVHQVGWLAIGIGDPDYRGRGYGSDAMRLLVDYGFRELNLYRITLSTYSYNTRALHVYEKIGFVREGLLRGILQRDGKRYDEVMMGLLRSEWEQRGG